MEINKEALEGGVRLSSVRRTKKYLMIVQVIIVFAAVVLLLTTGGNVQLVPFYFDIGSFIYFVILMALVIGVEGFVFRLLEIKYIKSSSSKYYMLKTSTRRSLTVIAISAVVIVLLLTPFVANVIANATSEAGTTNTTSTFFNRDALGLTTVDRVRVISSQPAEVLIVSEANYLLYAGDIVGLRQHSEVSTLDATPGVELTMPQAPFGKYFIVVNSEEGAAVSFTVHRVLSPVFVGFVTLFAALFIGFNAGWIVYIYPLRKKFAKGAIYR